MSQNIVAGDRRRRKMITALWALAVAAVVIVLIYLERADILYILCTLGVAALLLVVAFSDLAHETRSQQLAQTPDTPGPRNRER